VDIRYAGFYYIKFGCGRYGFLKFGGAGVGEESEKKKI